MLISSHAKQSVGVGTVHSWDGVIVYQIYPRSFAEVGRSKGEGNLKGVISKLDYLRDIGVGAIWLSPFFPSPMKDGGYDISDHCAVDPRFGSLQDFGRLLAEAHKRNIRVVVDLVLNHTSDQHPKFLEESRHPSANPNDDWYIWRDGLGDGPPNNWASAFSLPNLERWQRGELKRGKNGLIPPVSAWAWSPGRKQWYLRTFALEQPDLNWDNPKVRAEFGRIMRFWIDRGVDGFRIDAFDRTAKNMALTNEERNPKYRDGKENPYFQLKKHNSSGFPGTFSRNLEVLSSVANAYPKRNLYMMIETTPYFDKTLLRLINILSPRHMGAFNFGRLDTPWDARLQQAQLDEYYGQLRIGAIGNQVTGNHDDRGRRATRIGAAAARTAMLVDLTLPGIKTVYQGDEAGFFDVTVPLKQRDDNLDGRDRVRTPMLWTDGKNAGFSRARPWLPVDPKYRKINIEAQLHDPLSPITLFKKLIQVAHRQLPLKHGTYAGLHTDDPRTLAYARTYKGDQIVVVANLSDSPVKPKITGTARRRGTILIGSSANQLELKVSLKDGIPLGPNESVIIMIMAA